MQFYNMTNSCIEFGAVSGCNELGPREWCQHQSDIMSLTVVRGGCVVVRPCSADTQTMSGIKHNQLEIAAIVCICVKSM